MMRRPLALLLSLALALPAPAPVLAADLPDLGDVAASELSPAAERKIGEQIIREIRWRDAAYLDDAEVEEYVNRLGQRLAAVSNNPGLDFDFFVVRDATLNAFALPGGFIGVHTGLILAAEGESEFASVLGHEIAHVTQRHIAQIVGKQSQSAMLMIASMLVAVLAARSNSDVSTAAIAAGQAGAIQSQLGYTRAFEREADRAGLETLDKAGLDVRGMPGFFERLQRNTRVYENNAPAYLRTHPLTTERIADMENRVGAMRYRQVPDSADFRFARAKLRANAGQPAEAVQELQDRLAREPKDEALAYGLARALMRAGRLDEAEARLQPLRAPAVLAVALDNGAWSQTPDKQWINQGRRQVPNSTHSLHTYKYSLAVLSPAAPLPDLSKLRLAIVPQSDPLAVGPGKPLRVQVLVDGKPAREVKLIGDYRGMPHEVSATTDAQGYAEVVVRNEGLNIIAAELYLPVKGNPDIEELGLFSSLTFLGQAHHE